ncbi:MAG: polyprenyl synthetase family protein [Microbacteriaceae bacterium]|nr:polyprenyl synthetase family protein [Microbacteriaceae bacterium]
MAESARLVDLIQADLDKFVDGREQQLLAISPELAPFVNYARDLLGGGKRFRALFCYWGWQATTGLSTSFDPLAEMSTEQHHRNDLESVVLAASGLEMFHAAALVHDDIMDRSDTRRGLPAVHKRFEQLHARGRWIGNSAEFGQSGGLLLGDLLLGWSDELFDEGVRTLSSAQSGLAARAHFNHMRTEVTAGQYLDIHDESAWQHFDEADLLDRAHRVIVYKSAKYSVEAPLAIGAAMGGATDEQLAALRQFGLPLGIAYQLRDDLLGVFGDPSLTGKPAGDDLREGKRTVLIAIARTALATNSRSLLDELLGDPELTDQQVRMLQASIRESGAVENVEGIIAKNVDLARLALVDAPISRAAREQLLILAGAVTQRTA